MPYILDRIKSESLKKEDNEKKKLNKGFTFKDALFSKIDLRESEFLQFLLSNNKTINEEDRNMFLTVNKIRNFSDNPNTNTNFYHKKRHDLSRTKSDKFFRNTIDNEHKEFKFIKQEKNKCILPPSRQLNYCKSEKTIHTKTIEFSEVNKSQPTKIKLSEIKHLDFNKIIHNVGFNSQDQNKTYLFRARSRNKNPSVKFAKKAIFTKFNNEILDKVQIDNRVPNTNQELKSTKSFIRIKKPLPNLFSAKYSNKPV